MEKLFETIKMNKEGSEKVEMALWNTSGTAWELGLIEFWSSTDNSVEDKEFPVSSLIAALYKGDAWQDI